MKKNLCRTLLLFIVVLSFSASAFAQNPPGPQNFGNPPPQQGQQGPPGQPPNPQDGLKAALGILVIDTIISREQAVTILKYFNKDMAATKGLTMEQMQEYQAKKKAAHQDPLSLLVKDRVITKEKAVLIEQAMFRGHPPQGAPGGGETTQVKTTAAYTQSGKIITKNNQAITASNNDQSGIKVADGGTLTLTDATVTTTGVTSSDENSNFYGLNAGILAESASKINITDSTITTSGNGANAVFATGTGSAITLSDVKIKTTADSSRGLDATLKGTVTATNVDITTAGAHSAALATDRGNGTIHVTGGTMRTSGVGSPGIYSTGDITVSDATITATGSEAAVVEGKNSITLKNTIISGAKLRGLMMYQSFSGDAEVGTSHFTMEGGSLTAEVGPLFFATNTDAVIALKSVNLTAKSGTLLTVGADNWGTAGANGAIVEFKADNQILNGNIICDKISTIKVNLQNNSLLTGTINKDNTAKSMSLVLDKTSTWSVTGTSYLHSLTNDDTTLANIDDNGFTIYYDANASENSWLGNKTYILADGGLLKPQK